MPVTGPSLQNCYKVTTLVSDIVHQRFRREVARVATEPILFTITPVYTCNIL